MKWSVYYKYEDCEWQKVPTWDYVVTEGIKEALLVIRDWFITTHRDMSLYDFTVEPWVEGKERPDATEGIPGKNVLNDMFKDIEEKEDRWRRERKKLRDLKRRRGKQHKRPEKRYSSHHPWENTKVFFPQDRTYRNKT